jgi:hypothetical protein
MIIIKSKPLMEKRKHSSYVRRMLYESLEYTSLEDAKTDISYRLKQTFPRATVKSEIVSSTKLATFTIVMPDFELRLWWKGLGEPNSPYSIFGYRSKVYNALSLDEAISTLKRLFSSWEPPENDLNMRLLMASMENARTQKGYNFFGFRGDTRHISVGMRLNVSSNGLGSLSTFGDSSKLPGVSSVGIQESKNPKKISLSWRAFVSVNYGKNRSLIGGHSASFGDDVLIARMDGKDWEVNEYVIKGADVLIVIK